MTVQQERLQAQQTSTRSEHTIGLDGSAPDVCAAALGANGVCKTDVGIQVGLLTGGDDRSYALGLTSSLVSQGIFVDFIGSNTVDGPELHNTPLVNFLNLRGDQRENVNAVRKAIRILTYYVRLVLYAARAKPRLLHILWNNKFEFVDRVLLMLYYRSLGKRVVFTAHNVNAAKRDSKDNWVNRLTLRIQYHLCNHIFVHTDRMKADLLSEFGVRANKISVIPFGINNAFPHGQITSKEAKERLGVSFTKKTALFFGQIAPYKGLEYLIAAMGELNKRGENFLLVIAGKVKPGNAAYWDEIQREISRAGLRKQVIEKIQFIPDEEVELYFKAADVVILPYTDIFQSGVPFLAYSFGLPVIATDVGSLREDIIEERTGFMCKPKDPADLARAIKAYFESELFRNLATRRGEIQIYANERHSWTKAGDITSGVYSRLLERR